jgi:hypothetical protein
MKPFQDEGKNLLIDELGNSINIFMTNLTYFELIPERLSSRVENSRRILMRSSQGPTDHQPPPKCLLPFYQKAK